MPQVDIITGEHRRRSWTAEEKQAVLAAAFAPGAVVREVARRVNVSTGQLYTWRKELMKKKPTGTDGFSRVVAVDDLSRPRTLPRRAACAAVDYSSAAALPPPAVAPPQPMPACELPAIEIEAGNHKIRIPPTMPAALAAAVVRALVRRG
jgi:transposase